MVSRSGQRAKERHEARIAAKYAKWAGDYKKVEEIKKKSKEESQRISHERGRTEEKTFQQRNVFRQSLNDILMREGQSRPFNAQVKALKQSYSPFEDVRQRNIQRRVYKQQPEQDNSWMGRAKRFAGGMSAMFQQEQQKPIGQRISKGAQRAFLGPIAGTQTGRKFAAAIPQYAARGALSIGLETPLGKPFEEAGRREIHPEEFGIEKIIGREPIKGVGTRALEYEEKLKEKGYKHPTMLAVAGTTGATAFDLWISGGGKQVISNIAKSKSPKYIASLLKGKVADNLVDGLARQLVDIDNTDDVARMIKQFQKPLIQKGGKPSKAFEEYFSKKKAIPKPEPYIVKKEGILTKALKERQVELKSRLRRQEEFGGRTLLPLKSPLGIHTTGDIYPYKKAIKRQHQATIELVKSQGEKISDIDIRRFREKNLLGPETVDDII